MMKNRVRGIITGISLILVAVALVLWKLGVITLKFSLWGVNWFWGLVAIVLAFYAFCSLFELNFAGLFFPAAIICIIFAEPWHLTAITPWVVLIVAALLTIAFDNIFPTRPGKRSFLVKRHGYSSDENHAYFALRMGESAKYFRSECLEDVDLTMTMGGMSVYFDNVTVPSGEIRIHTRTSFGETHLFVPKEWKIVTDVRDTFGGCNFSGLPDESDESSIRCVIDGSVFCGQVVIDRI